MSPSISSLSDSVKQGLRDSLTSSGALNAIVLRFNRNQREFVKSCFRFSMTSMDLTTIKNRPQPFIQVTFFWWNFTKISIPVCGRDWRNDGLLPWHLPHLDHRCFFRSTKTYLMLPTYFFPHLLLPMLQSAVVTAGTYVVVDVAESPLRLVLLKTKRD